MSSCSRARRVRRAGAPAGFLDRYVQDDGRVVRRRPGRRHGLARARRTRCCSRSPPTTRSASRASGTGRARTCSARTGCSPGAGRTGAWSTTSRRPTPTSTRRARCCWPASASTSRATATPRATSSRRSSTARRRGQPTARCSSPVRGRATARSSRTRRYWSPKAFQQLGFQKVEQSSRQLTERLLEAGLPPDWARVEPFGVFPSGPAVGRERRGLLVRRRPAADPARRVVQSGRPRARSGDVGHAARRSGRGATRARWGAGHRGRASRGLRRRGGGRLGGGRPRRGARPARPRAAARRRAPELLRLRRGWSSRARCSRTVRWAAARAARRRGPGARPGPGRPATSRAARARAGSRR